MPQSSQKVAITGATGFVARHVRRHLSEGGTWLSSISRNDFKSLRGEKKIITEHYDPEAILSGIRGADAMIHLVGLGSQSVADDFDSVNFLLTRKMVDLCRKAGIKKFVYLSGLGVSKNSPLGYFLSKYRAEQAVMQSGLDFTVFRPSYIVGKDDLFTKHLKKQIRRGLITVPGSGRFQIQPVHVGDASRVISESLTGKKFSNGVFDLVGPELMTYGSYVRLFSRHARTRIKKTPLEKAYHDAISGRGSDFGVDDLNLLVGDFHGDFKKLEKASSVRFRSVAKLLQSGVLP